jgi:hypothetical protein
MDGSGIILDAHWGSLYVGYHNDAGEPVVMVDGRELTLPGGAAATPGNFEWGWLGQQAASTRPGNPLPRDGCQEG